MISRHSLQNQDIIDNELDTSAYKYIHLCFTRRKRAGRRFVVPGADDWSIAESSIGSSLERERERELGESEEEESIYVRRQKAV